jgi:ABC-type polysaccharide/polyol phosphate transport system ATPase subunit
VDTVIRVVDVSKRFTLHKEESLKDRVVNFRRTHEHRRDFWALRNVELEIGSGSTLGLIGANGSGKSTLLKLIGGILTPTSGYVERRGRLAALLELGAGFHGDLTGRENVYLNASILGLSRAQTERYFDDIVDFSGIEPFIDTQVKFYSSGMYVRLAFAVAVHVDPEILLVDEVLAVGDEPFQRKCLDRIKQFQSDGLGIVAEVHRLNIQGIGRQVWRDHFRRQRHSSSMSPNFSLNSGEALRTSSQSKKASGVSWDMKGNLVSVSAHSCMDLPKKCESPKGGGMMIRQTGVTPAPPAACDG